MSWRRNIEDEQGPSEAAGDPSFELSFDFTDSSLSSIQLGAPADWLVPLGAPEDPQALQHGDYCFFTRGLCVSVSDAKIVGFLLFFEPDLDYDVFQGGLFIGPRKISLKQSSGEKIIAALFGEPYFKDRDEEGEVILFYERPGAVEWQFEITDEGSLKALNVLTPGLLSDPVQRQAFGVKAGWPADGERIDTMTSTMGSSEPPG